MDDLMERIVSARRQLLSSGEVPAQVCVQIEDARELVGKPAIFGMPITFEAHARSRVIAASGTTIPL